MAYLKLPIPLLSVHPDSSLFTLFLLTIFILCTDHCRYKAAMSAGTFVIHYSIKKQGGFMPTNALTRTTGLFPSSMEEFFKPWNEWFNDGGRFGRPVTMPAVNISENGEVYKVSLAAPGLKKSDFKIDVEGNTLTISSEKEENKEEKDERHTRKEYNYTSFSRSFTLPDDVLKDKIDAAYEDGVLRLTLPKNENTKKAALSKHIPVK